MKNNEKKSCTLWLCILIGLLATDLIFMLANCTFKFLSDDWVRTCGGCALCLIAAVSFTVVNICKADQES